MFNDADWLTSPSGDRTKTLHYEDFFKNGLQPTLEYGEKYSDVVYAKRILQGMGYKVLVGMSFHVFDRPHNLNR